MLVLRFFLGEYYVFNDFPLISKVFINIHEYKNKIICIFDHSMIVLHPLSPFI